MAPILNTYRLLLADAVTYNTLSLTLLTAGRVLQAWTLHCYQWALLTLSYSGPFQRSIWENHLENHFLTVKWVVKLIVNNCSSKKKKNLFLVSWSRSLYMSSFPSTKEENVVWVWVLQRAGLWPFDIQSGACLFFWGGWLLEEQLPLVSCHPPLAFHTWLLTWVSSHSAQTSNIH